MNKPDETNNKTIGPIRAVLAGQLLVNLPVVAIFLLIRYGGAFLFPQLSIWFLLIAGFICGWLWWSLTLPRWRAWVERVSTSPETTEKLANWTLLTWPQSLAIEQTNAENEEESPEETNDGVE